MPSSASLASTHIHVHLCIVWSFFLQTPEVLHKAPIQRGFAHTCISTCTHFSLFSQRCWGAPQKSHTEGLHKVPIQRRLCTHICVFWSSLWQILGVLHKAPIKGAWQSYTKGKRGLYKAPIQSRLSKASIVFIHTLTFQSFSNRYREMLHEGP